MLRHAPQIVSTLVWVAVCLFALWKGRAAPRLMGAALLINMAEVIVLDPFDRPYHVHKSLVIGDLIVLGAAVYAMRWSRRPWLACAIAFLTLSLATHAAKALDLTLGGWAYVTLAVFWGYAVLACVLVGTMVEQRSR